MSDEPPPKRVRKGTRSCIECRHRKVKCTWPSERAEACQNCLARGMPCEQQVYMTPTADMVKVSSRARIAHVETDLTRLWAAVHHLESKLGVEKSRSTGAISKRPLRTERSTDTDHDDEDSDASTMSPTAPPAHLLQLFDNRMLDTDTYQPAQSTPAARTSHRTRAVALLRKLMPAREDMVLITAHASTWLSLYSALFPMLPILRSPDKMLDQYDKLQDSPSNLIEMAALLLSVAITLQQAPADVVTQAAKSIKDVPTFVKEVSDTVEKVFVYDDTLAGTLDGLETTLLFVRLQLGRTRIKKMWLLSRRVIALAQLQGLPRASAIYWSRQGSEEEPPTAALELLQRKADFWASLCAIDRVASLMFSLPIASAGTPPPRRPVIDADGNVDNQGFLHSLADIGSRVMELDNIRPAGRPLSELFNASLGCDQELRSLANQTPQSWWKINELKFTAQALVQYWWFYISARAHLQLALLHDSDSRDHNYLFFFTTCTEVCQEMAKRYAVVRHLLPGGFFTNPIVDIQALTAAVFLLLTRRRQSGTTLDPTAQASERLLEGITSTMTAAAHQPGGAFAQKASKALQSLHSLLSAAETQTTSTSPGKKSEKPPEKLTLNLPLVGRIHVSRRVDATSDPPPKTQPAPPAPPTSQWPPPAYVLPTPTPTVPATTLPLPIPSQPTALPFTPPAMQQTWTTTPPPTSAASSVGAVAVPQFSYSMEIPEMVPFPFLLGEEDEEFFGDGSGGGMGLGGGGMGMMEMEAMSGGGGSGSGGWEWAMF